MSILRSRGGWGLFGILLSPALACSVLTSLGGLTGGGGNDAGEDAPVVADDAGGTIVPSGPEASDDAGPLPATDANDAAQTSVDAASPCTDGGIVCNGACVDPVTDPSNCNGCGNVCPSGVCGTTLTAPMTSLPPRWVFNGTASYDTSAPSAELTKANVNGQAGTFVYENAIVVDTFDARFQFRIGLQGNGRSDGMGFMIEQTGATGVGATGGGLGMAGLAGFGVELDIYDNGYCGDSSGDHVGVDDLSICPAQAGMPTSLFEADVSAVVDLADTHWHTADVSLASGALSLSIDGVSVISGVTLSGLPAGGAYYFGFAGGTGGLVFSDGGAAGSRQEVKNVVVTFPTPRCL